MLHPPRLPGPARPRGRAARATARTHWDALHRETIDRLCPYLDSRARAARSGWPPRRRPRLYAVHMARSPCGWCVGGGEGHINVACGRAASPGRGPRARCSSTDLLLTCCGRAARPHSSRRHSCVPRPARPRPREPSARESARPTSAPRCRRSRIAALSLLRFALLAEGPHRLRLPGLSPSPSLRLARVRSVDAQGAARAAALR